MAKPYLTDLESIISKIPACQELGDGVVCKHFFSGAAAYVTGGFFMSLSPVGLALKLPKQDLEELFDQGATALRYFPKAPIKKDYAVLPPHIGDDNNALNHWVLRSIAFVSSPKSN